MNQIIHLSKFPEEVILEIFSWLDGEALENCSKVNVLFRRISMRATLWKSLFPNETGTGEQVREKFLKRITSIPHLLREVERTFDRASFTTLEVMRMHAPSGDQTLEISVYKPQQIHMQPSLLGDCFLKIHENIPANLGKIGIIEWLDQDSSPLIIKLEACGMTHQTINQLSQQIWRIFQQRVKQPEREYYKKIALKIFIPIVAIIAYSVLSRIE